MRILIITTFYPPDTAVAAVRPYMFAKYLTQRGHDVTVLRSGEFYNSASDFFDMSIPVRVISYLGPDSPAERYARGEQKEFPCAVSKNRLGKLPAWMQKLILKAYSPIVFVRRQKAAQSAFQKQKAALDLLREEHFDVVFSTFARQENIAAGQYAAKLFNCKLIQDFRDPVADIVFHQGRQFKILKRIQDDAIINADGVTAVSEGLRKKLFHNLDTNVPNITLNNGYEPAEVVDCDVVMESDSFSICYTGILYGELRDFTPLLRALKCLAEENRIDLSKVKLHYAGRDFSILKELAEKMDMTEVIVNHGYVSRAEAARLQNTSDLFLVLSWNLKDSQGILTGKFYEGIRARKPILSLISGDVPNCELNILNEKYHYGFCYEDCRKEEQFSRLCDFLANAYREKMEFGKVQFQVNPELEAAFRYDHLAQQLEDFIQKI